MRQSGPEKLIRDYLDSLRGRVNTVRLLGFSEPRALEKVFVELTIVEDYIRPRVHAPFLGMMEPEMRRQRNPFTGDRNNPVEESKPQTVKPDDLLRSRTRAVVTGAPGCGKTTLLRYLTYKTIEGDKFLPVFLELKTIVEKDLTKADGDLASLLFNKTLCAGAHLTAAKRKQLRQYFDARLTAGEAMIFLDGLDEVSGTGFFSRLRNSISDFLRSDYRDNTLIISTRPYALHSARIEGLKEMEIAPLNQRQTEEFIDHYYGDDETVKSLVKNLRRNREREITRVPFLLGAVIELHRAGFKVAHDRIELYRQLVSQLAGQLDKEKGVSRFHIHAPEGQLKLDFLKEIACERLLIDEVKAESDESEAARLIFTDDVLFEKAKRYVKRPEHTGIRADYLAADVKATPLLRQVGIDAYAFSHLTVQEFLAASALANREDCEEVFCRAYFNSTIAGMEVLPMTLGMVNRADDLYARLEGLPESLTFTNLRLRARGLSYGAVISERRVMGLAERLADFVEGRTIEEDPYLRIIARSFNSPRGRFSHLPIDSLKPLLNNEDSDVHWRAAEALGRIGSDRAVDALLAALDKNAFVRDRAAEALGWIGSDRAVDALISALKDNDSGVRDRADEALRQIGSDRVVDALISALKDENYFVHLRAVDALGQIGSERAVDALFSALKDEDSNVRWRAAEALGQIGSDRAVDALFSALKDKNGFVRLRAAIALGQVGSDRVVDALFSALKDEDSNVRWRAAEALGRIGSDRAVDALISALKDDDSDVRDRAAEALGQIGSDRAVDALFSALKDKNGFVHLRAADALGQIGSERAVDALLAALKDDDTFVRGSAASGLADLPDKAITAGLSRSLSHTDDFIRRKAVQVIGYYRTDTAMLEELSRLAESDPSEEVRRAASDAREKFIRKLQLFGLQQTAIEMQREHFIRQKYHEALNEEDIHIKGRALEELLAALIASIEGFIEFERNVITADEEIDIVFRNESRDPFWQKFGPVFLVECKNWKSQRVGKNEFNDLRDKIKNRAGQCNLGFLVCTEVFADTIDTRMLRFSRGKRLIIPIDGERLRQLVESSDRSALLKQFTTDASLK